MSKEIKLPEIADNVTTAVVLEILVSQGDTVEADDILAEMESDKASFELPSEVAGVVKEVKVSEGDEVKVGQVMFVIDEEAAGSDKKEKKEEPEKKEEKAEKKEDSKDQQEEDTSEQKEEESSEKDEQSQEKQSAPAASFVAEEPAKSASHVAASPAVRRLAREIGVDLTRVKGSGPADRVTEEDVKAFAKQLIQQKSASAGGGIADDFQLPDFSKYGEIRREKMDTIRKLTAKAMSGSWQNIPHVFQFDKADVTELEKFRKDYSKYVEKKGAKLTVTAILLKLSAVALKTFPKFNASVDMNNEEIIFKDYVNIGVAVDTERGLIVPVIRDVDKKSITELSVELNELAEKARTKKIKPDDLQGANFTISNLGGIGGTNFTPIVNRPAVAILGVSRSQMEPVWMDGEFQPRMMLPLSLSYDHRVIDGADGARFLRWLCEAMQNPLVTMF